MPDDREQGLDIQVGSQTVNPTGTPIVRPVRPAGPEFERSESLTEKLVGVPKEELDEKLKGKEEK